jgi:hypothetical protein
MIPMKLLYAALATLLLPLTLNGCASNPAFMVGKDGDKGFLMKKLKRV